jgi:hypothetical protein
MYYDKIWLGFLIGGCLGILIAFAIEVILLPIDNRDAQAVYACSEQRDLSDLSDANLLSEYKKK